jgi:Uma2 family endonuclease
MPAVLARLSEAEYLARERQGEERHEFINGSMVVVPGSSKIHTRICTNLTLALAPAAFASQCRFACENGQLRVPSGRIYYPDVMVCCVDSHDLYVEEHPCLLIEVLSSSTEAKDRGQKLDDYTSIASVEQYILVSQREQRLTVFRRQRQTQANTQANDWQVQFFGPASSLTIGCLGLELALAQVYRGVVFASEQAASTP